MNKKFFVLTVICMLISSFAFAGTVNVKGDVEKDGKLFIDLNWTIDTMNYKDKSGKTLPPEKVREIMYNEMWRATLPKLIEKTKGYDVSFDDCKFTYLEEITKMTQERPDRTKIYNVSLKMRFDVPVMKHATQVVTNNPVEEKKQVKYFENLRPRFMGQRE